MYENRVLRNLFWPKMNEVTGDGGHCTVKNFMVLILTTQNSGYPVTRNEMDGACYIYVDRKCGYTIIVGKPEGKRSFGRPRRRWKEN